MISRAIVLLIDSDGDEMDSLSAYLGSNGFETIGAADSLSGLRQFFNIHPDVIIVDLEVAEITGWQLIARIRELSDTPIVVMASEATNDHVSRALQLGVAGFLARPFYPNELLVRLNGILSRRPDVDEKRWVYQRNGLTVDLRSCEVFVEGAPVQLTGTEYRLLTYLIEHRGWVLSHDQILSHVWGSDYVGEKDQVKLYIWYLRRKIENDPKRPTMIVTKRGLGYSFVG